MHQLEKINYQNLSLKSMSGEIFLLKKLFTDGKQRLKKHTIVKSLNS